MHFSKRQLLQKISRHFSDRACAKKMRKDPSCFFTLRQLCEKVGIPTDALPENVQNRLDTTVTQISRYGDRFTNNCVCVQLYDDSDALLQKASAQGALVCVTDHRIENVPCIVVGDTAEMYARLCGIYRDMTEIETTVVAGSIGKTTTKKMIEAVYRQTFHTLCDAGNDNILDSVGSICQHIPAGAQKWIVELSEDTPGVLAKMAGIAKPDVVVYTAMDKSHIELYGSEEAIIQEFATVAQKLREGGVCIMCRDEHNPAQLLSGVRMQFVSQKDRDADYFADDVRVDTQGLTFTVHVRATGKAYPVRLHNIFAVHNVMSALLAFAAGTVAGMAPEQIVRGLGTFRTSGIRQNIFKSSTTTVYADCYNAVAKSIRSAVQAAEQIPIHSGCKRIAVLGDVAEAGEYTESTHLEIVDIVNHSNFAALLTCGENLRRALEQRAVRDDLQVFVFDNQKDMNKALKKLVKRGDLVLFKASHTGNLKVSILSVFPIAYLREAVRYYVPRLKWHFQVITH